MSYKAREAAILAGSFLFSPAFPERKLRGIAGLNIWQSIKRL
jgi:hypothetical protein